MNESWFETDSFQTFKLPLIEQYQIAISAGTLQTLEGTVTYNQGDYIITGPQGEKYPISPAIFSQLKDDHQNGTCTPKSIFKIAKLADHDGEIQTAWGALKYTNNEDFIVRHGESDFGVVKKEIFFKTYDTSNIPNIKN